MTQQPIIIIGAGGHANVVADALKELGCALLGSLSVQKKDFDQELIEGVKVLGNDKVLENHSDYAPHKIKLALGIGSIKGGTERAKIVEEFTSKGYEFVSFVHPRAFVSSTVKLGLGTQVMAGAAIQTGAVIGEHAIINTGAVVDHHCELETFVHVAPNATLSGNVRVGGFSHIGLGASILQGIEIGSLCTIGAGSVVLKNVQSEVTAVGNPAKIV